MSVETKNEVSGTEEKNVNKGISKERLARFCYEDESEIEWVDDKESKEKSE